MVEPFDRLRSDLAARYIVERELGRGGMATVYLAQDVKHQRQVAVKLMHPDIAAAVGADRFLREIRIAAQLSHPHIIPLHDSGEAAGSLYYVMPYVAGESLRERLVRERQLPLDEALRITREVADALAYAHAQGIVHRDIKPENILLSAQHAFVADFGIARAVAPADGVRLTSDGMAVGTPAYMSPEQAAGGVLDGRSDLYSLGCVLYEMLAGAPPFSGPTPQAVMARHSLDPVPPIRTVRDTVSPGLETAIRQVLAKVPADRFPTAVAFVAALPKPGQPAAGPSPAGGRLWRQRSWMALGAFAIPLLFWLASTAPSEPLDPDRVVVFPFTMSGSGTRRPGLGEDASLALHDALNGSRQLKSSDGWRLLEAPQREDVARLSSRAARHLARAQHAAWYIEGRLLVGDSVRVFLTLHDLVSDSTLELAMAFGPDEDAWRMGLDAARHVLAARFVPGRLVDLEALSARSSAATASFLKGEQAYRRAHFAEALTHYREAVRADSSFALAALRGAQLASWNHGQAEALALIRVAIARDSLLTPRFAQLARGFKAYLDFAADSAVRHFRLALEMDLQWPDAWMGLGEVYTHLLPAESPLDSLAAAAFAEVHRLDPGFGPVLYHLMEIALRSGRAREAEGLMRQFKAGSPDSAELGPTELMLACVKRGLDREGWLAAARRHPDDVSQAARALAVGGLRQPDCAANAWSAILAVDTEPGRRWGALLGLQSVLAARGRLDEVRRLLDADTVPRAEAWRLYILDDEAEGRFANEAGKAADRLRTAFRATAPVALRSNRLWSLAVWDAQRGPPDELGALADSLAARAGRSADRLDSLLLRSVAARAALRRGDTALALERLVALVPTTGRTPLTWDPWESLGGERLLLAKLRLARGEYAEAYRVAENFDAPGPVPYLIYLPASLSLRLRAARAMGWGRAADGVRARLLALGRNDLVR